MGLEKALSSAVGQGGDTIIPQLADQIIPFIRQKSYLRQFLQSFTMPTETYRFPKLTQGNSVYYVGEAASAPESLMTTGTIELNAKKLMVALAISAELEEDAVVPIVPVVRDDMAKAFALAEENVFINGDTTHTATQTDPASATEADWCFTRQCKTLKNCWKVLKSIYYNVISYIEVSVNCLKNDRIMQFA